MSFLLFLTSIVFFLWIIRNILFWVALWQVKEYRLDRLWIHLKDTKQGRTILFSPLLLFKILGIFAYGYAISFRDDLLPYQLFVAILFGIQSYAVFNEFSSRLTKRPVLTHKAFILIFFSVSFAVLLFLFPLIFEGFFWLLIIDRLTPFVISFFVLLLSFPTEFYQDIQVRRAIKKIAKRRNLLVIGVTGSYGKSSTKDFTAQILGKEFRVLKTKGTNNTPIGIANTILSGLKDNTQIFVVEMGAYKRGEITEMCQMVHPRMGILTAVNDQHLSLFGSLENIMKAKYELIEAIPKNGLALFNGNNKNVYQLYKQTKKRKALYVCGGLLKANIVAKNIVVEKTYIMFDILYRNKKIKMKAPLIGGHTIENILPAIFIAKYLGMNEEKIKKAVAQLVSPPKTMERDEIGGVTIIDDTFNTNPEAVMAALDYMNIYETKKIIVLQPMIELGKEGNNEHYRIGKAIGSVCDYVFLTNKNFYSSLTKGVLASGRRCIVKTGSLSQLPTMVSNVSKKGDIVVFEGKEAGLVLDKMI